MEISIGCDYEFMLGQWIILLALQLIDENILQGIWRIFELMVRLECLED